MEINNILQEHHENTILKHYNEIDLNFPNTIAYEDLNKVYIPGVIKAVKHVGDKLLITFSKGDNHVLVVAATRQGKTTQCVITQIICFAEQPIKRSFMVSDPKGELYRLLAELLRQLGYEVVLLNFKDYTHSETFNPLTVIFREYHRAQEIGDEVEVVKTDKGFRNRFQGVIYEDQDAMDQAIEQAQAKMIADVEARLGEFVNTILPQDSGNQKYWDQAGRDWAMATLCAMLEDSLLPEGPCRITEDTFSLDTMFKIMESLTADNDFDDGEFFSGRAPGSIALKYAKHIMENADVTMRCIISCFPSKVRAYRSGAMRFLTGSSSFEFSKLTSGKPIAVFISYPDYDSSYYEIINMFVQQTYKYLVDYADNQPYGKLDVPFYYILDEFGSFPVIEGFQNKITAAGGRNIFFELILQSHHQLDYVYGKDYADIIRSCLNIHIFLGSNDPYTLELISKECGECTKLSPTSVLNGNRGVIDRRDYETLPCLSKSTLASLQPGEAIVTEINSGYVLFSKLERYFNCKEFANLPLSSVKDYYGKINPLDKRYNYICPTRKKKKKKDDDWF